MDPGKGMYIGDMDRWTPVRSILLLLRPWMGYDYTVIKVVCWVELHEQRRLCPIFVKIWIPINRTQQCGIGVTRNPQKFRGLMGCQRDPRIWGVTFPIYLHKNILSKKPYIYIFLCHLCLPQFLQSNSTHYKLKS